MRFNILPLPFEEMDRNALNSNKGIGGGVERPPSPTLLSGEVTNLLCNGQASMRDGRFVPPAAISAAKAANAALLRSEVDVAATFVVAGRAGRV